jgi:GNAT superfamily N-acetyltransferase
VEEEVTVRRAGLHDAETLLELQEEFYVHGGFAWERPGKEQAMRQLLADESLGRIVVLERSRIIGYIVIAFGFSLEFCGRDAFVDELFVTEHARGAGIGTRALAEAENVCREEGIRALHLEVEFENESAKRLYERQGYRAHTRYLMTKTF